VSFSDGPGAIRAAVVGAGPVGSIHARALAAIDRIELIGICGRTTPKAEALAAEHRVPAYSSVAEMLQHGRPDLACVCTGNTEHVQPMREALQAGVHVFVEKPIAFRVEEARSMVDLARERGVRLGVDFNHRFSEPYRRARAFVDDGRIGRPGYLLMKMAGDLYKEVADPYGMLIETQGHCFDMLRHFGGEVDEVSALLGDPRGMGVYTSAAIGLRFRSGAVGSILGSWDSSYDHPQAQLFEFSGTDGRVVVENVVDAVRLYDHAEAAYTEWRPGLFDTKRRDFWHTIDAHLAAFVDAIDRGVSPPVTGEDGLRALELTFAAIRSFEERAPVSV
jgi:predicted dehydrogenase